MGELTDCTGRCIGPCAVYLTGVVLAVEDPGVRGSRNVCAEDAFVGSLDHVYGGISLSLGNDCDRIHTIVNTRVNS